MNNSPIKFKDDKYDIKIAWRKFADGLLKNVETIKNKAEQKYIRDIAMDIPYAERSKLRVKIKRCEIEKIKLKAERKDFNLNENDYEIINEQGFEKWFKNYDGYLWPSIKSN